MSRGLRFVLFGIGFLVATGLQAARAAEGYLCEGGRIVHVPAGRLEDMKRTDPCIAGYFGLKVTVAPADAGAGASAPVTPPSVTAPSTPAAPAAAAQTRVPDRPAAVPPVALRPLEDADLVVRLHLVPQRLAARPSSPRAADGTDYRNVPLLNAPPGSPSVFRHEH